LAKILIEQICIFVALPASEQGVEGFKGRKRLAREPKRSPAALFVRTEPNRKIAYHFLFCARRFFNFLKERAIFLRGSAVWRHGGGAERMDFFRNF